MIDTININKSIRETLEKYFPDINCQIKDIKTMVAPCFYIKLIAESSKKYNRTYETNTFSFDIIYFSDTTTLLDLMEKKRILKTLFKKPLKVEDGSIIKWIETSSLTFNLNEDGYILNSTIEFNITQKTENLSEVDYENTYDDEDFNKEMMEILEIKS